MPACMRLAVMASMLCCLPLASAVTPDPKAIAKLVGDAFLAQSAPPEQNATGQWVCPEVNARSCGLMQWEYGGALIFDGMYECVKEFGFTEWGERMDAYLDPYAQHKVYGKQYQRYAPGYAPGYDLAHNITRPWEKSVGDYSALFPIAYLQRALSQGKTSGPDIDLALVAANHYVLGWPHRLSDGTFSRLQAKFWPNEKSDKVGSFVWGDDQTMGTMLIARMAPLFKNKEYAAEVTRQQIGFAKRLRDPKDGLNYHGYNAEDNHESCCKWGRANGWGMLGHAEAIASMAAWPEGYPNQTANEEVRTIFKQHATAAKNTQAPDGRWHQLLNDTSPGSFLETSATAMFLSALTRGVSEGVLDRGEYTPVIKKAWTGLASTVLGNGTVTGVCCGTGIMPNAQSYYNRSTFYGCSGPGGAGALLYAAVDLVKAGF